MGPLPQGQRIRRACAALLRWLHAAPAVPHIVTFLLSENNSPREMAAASGLCLDSDYSPGIRNMQRYGIWIQVCRFQVSALGEAPSDLALCRLSEWPL